MSLTQQDLQAITAIVKDTVAAIVYPAIEELRLQTAAGFAAVDERFARVDERFAQIDQRLDHIDRRLDLMDERFDRMDERFDHMDQRFDKLEGRVENSESGIQGIKQILVRIEMYQRGNTAHLEEHDARIAKIERHIGLSPA